MLRCARARLATSRREHDGRAWLAWHVAALGRWPHNRELPKLATLLATPPARVRQTPDQMMAIFSAIASAQNSSSVH